ncbi:hypothetical protein BBK36DRAFT_1155329 [Trichoderma citrinoviride]|uniref:F-box domain-containing protein n=1 Tax=Trichoderma citrinoviride TaxID=58853 RepID=A0A2T4BMI2_9HYPO|nr:hypothetical protein BBK36DRAFT_1155329 [Trichoderma citrinoviride]PTB70528.1 hypothetical protein BBK36DRAFT_1155329 [Trichoderma citrinoviride]
MESIFEDDLEDDDDVMRDDPAFPPLYYVQTPEKNGVYTRSFEISEHVFPPYLQTIPHYMKLFIVMDPTGLRSSLPSTFPSMFFYPASKPLPAEFHIPYHDRPNEFYVSLTHDSALFNISDSSPAPTSKPTAPHKVLRSTELLESIFLKLDPVTILTSIQRVNKTWKGVVDGSTALQRKLYFAPDGKAKLGLHPQAQWLKDDRENFPAVNSLLARYFESCFFSFGHIYGWLRRAESFYEHKWTRHHHRLKRMNLPWEHSAIYQPMLDEKLDGRATLQAMQERERFTRSGASWRNMLVCQPPIFSFGVMIFQPDKGTSALPQRMEKAIIKAHDMDVGLCMGQLYDFVQERAGHHPLSSLWFRVFWFEPHGPWTSDLCRDTAHELALETDLIIEMFHSSDCSLAYHPRDPPRPETFDRIFQSKDFKPHDWVPAGVAVDNASEGYEALSPLDGDQNRIWCGFAGK